MQGATAITAADNVAATQLLWHRLDLEVDFAGRYVRGKSTVWLRHWMVAEEPPHETVSLHCRQCRVLGVKVNGEDAPFEHMDPLIGVCRPKDRDAETFDLLYRSLLWKAGGHDTGELNITLGPSSGASPGRRKGPDPPDPLPGNASGRVRELLSAVRGLLKMDEDHPGETIPGREGYVAQYLKIEVTYTLEDPQAGLVWRHHGNVSGAKGMEMHCHTTYSASGIGVDTARCWFPCLDHVSSTCVFQLNLKLNDPSLIPVFSGALLEQDGKGSFSFCTDTPTTARGVGMAIGPFKVWYDPEAPRMKAYYLEDGYGPSSLVPTNPNGVASLVGNKRRRGLRRSPTDGSDILGDSSDGSSGIAVSFKEAVTSTMSHMLEVVRFAEDWLDADYPFGTARIVFVAGMPETFASFGGMVLLRSDYICHPSIPESDLPMQSRQVSSHALLAGWIEQAVRVKGGSAKWIHQGMADYVTERWIESSQGAEEAQLRQWHAMREAVRSDQELGSPSINPPDPDAYILESMDPAVAAFTRLKSLVLMYMLEARIDRDSLQLALRGMVRLLSDEVKRKFTEDPPLSIILEPTIKKEDIEEEATHIVEGSSKKEEEEQAEEHQKAAGEESEANADEAQKEGEAMEESETNAEKEVKHCESEDSNTKKKEERGNDSDINDIPTEEGGGGAMEESEKDLGKVKDGDSNVMEESGMDGKEEKEQGEEKKKEVEEEEREKLAAEKRRALLELLACYEDRIRPPVAVDSLVFLKNLKQVAMAAGNDTGPELTENFLQQWVCGQGVAFFRCGIGYNRRARTLDVVFLDVVPPWQEGYRSGGSIGIEIWETEGRWKFKEAVNAGQRHNWSLPMHSKHRRRKKGFRLQQKQGAGGDVDDDADTTTVARHQSGAATAAAVEDGVVGGGGGSGAPGTRGGGGEAVESSGSAKKEEPESIHKVREMSQSPVLWVTIDPEMRWFRSISMRKPEHQWINQLFSDTQADSQADALYGMAELPLPSSAATVPCALVHRAMGECLRGRVAHTQEEHAPCIRCTAAETLALWQNLHAPSSTAVAVESTSAWRGLKQLFTAFNERFTMRGDYLPNLFEDSCHYRMKKALIWSIGSVRARNGCSPPEVCRFLTTLLRENDNSENPFAEDYYISQCLVALGQLDTASESGLTEAALSNAFLEVQRWLKRDKLMGSHNGVITACALCAACELELVRGGVMQLRYASYASRVYPVSVRIAAVQCVVRVYLAEDTAAMAAVSAVSTAKAGGGSSGITESIDGGVGDASSPPTTSFMQSPSCGVGLGAALLWVLKLVLPQEEDPRLREAALAILLDAIEGRPPSASFQARFQSNYPLDGTMDPWCSRELYMHDSFASATPAPLRPRRFQGDAEAAEALWKLMTSGSIWNQRLRILALQVYESIWGFQVPPALAAVANDPSDPSNCRWKDVLDRAVAMRVQDWIMYRPSRREAPLRNWLRWHHFTSNGMKYPEPQPKGQYGPLTKDGMLEQGALEPLTAPRLKIKLNISGSKGAAVGE